MMGGFVYKPPARERVVCRVGLLLIYERGVPERAGKIRTVHEVRRQATDGLGFCSYRDGYRRFVQV
jgi:hypothetical protein